MIEALTADMLRISGPCNPIQLNWIYENGGFVGIIHSLKTMAFIHTKLRELKTHRNVHCKDMDQASNLKSSIR